MNSTLTNSTGTNQYYFTPTPNWDLIRELERIKKDIDDTIKREYEKGYKPLPNPWINPFPEYPYKPYPPFGIQQECLIERFFKDNPDATAAFISCPCPKCSPQI